MEKIVALAWGIALTVALSVWTWAIIERIGG